MRNISLQWILNGVCWVRKNQLFIIGKWKVLFLVFDKKLFMIFYKFYGSDRANLILLCFKLYFGTCGLIFLGFWLIRLSQKDDISPEEKFFGTALFFLGLHLYVPYIYELYRRIWDNETILRFVGSLATFYGNLGLMARQIISANRAVTKIYTALSKKPYYTRYFGYAVVPLIFGVLFWLHVSLLCELFFLSYRFVPYTDLEIWLLISFLPVWIILFRKSRSQKDSKR